MMVLPAGVLPKARGGGVVDDAAWGVDSQVCAGTNVLVGGAGASA